MAAAELPPAGQPTLKFGSGGAHVLWLQRRLNTLGYPVEVDGTFGKGTERAVIQFQQAKGLKADGQVGTNTWGSLQVAPGAGAAVELEGRKQALLAYLKPTFQGPARKALELAIADLGLVETDIAGRPAGTNGGTQIAHLIGGSPVPPSAYYRALGITDAKILKTMPPWCVLAVCSWVQRALGGPIDGPNAWKGLPFGQWFGATSQVEAWARRPGSGRWTSLEQVKQGAAVEPGMIFTMSRDGSDSDPTQDVKAGHVGLVVDCTGNRLITLDGNVGNAVRENRRDLASVRGFVRWW